jgi:hypothetical protein
MTWPKLPAVWTRSTVWTEKQKQAEAEAQVQAERGQAEAWAQFGHNLITAPASGKLTD